MSVGLAWKSAAKSNERLVNQNYAKLFLYWMPFSDGGDKARFGDNTDITSD